MKDSPGRGTCDSVSCLAIHEHSPLRLTTSTNATFRRASFIRRPEVRNSLVGFDLVECLPSIKASGRLAGCYSTGRPVIAGGAAFSPLWILRLSTPQNSVFEKWQENKRLMTGVPGPLVILFLPLFACPGIWARMRRTAANSRRREEYWAWRDSHQLNLRG